MKAIEKRADRLWAAYVVNRDGRCLLADEHCWGPLAAHHLIFRSQDPGKRVRWDPRTGATLCAFHHEDMHGHPLKHAAWREEHLGPVTLSALFAKLYGGARPDVAAIVDQLR